MFLTFQIYRSEVGTLFIVDNSQQAELQEPRRTRPPSRAEDRLPLRTTGRHKRFLRLLFLIPAVTCEGINESSSWIIAADQRRSGSDRLKSES